MARTAATTPFPTDKDNTMPTSTNAKSYSPSASRKVAFIGLGVMGYPMAGHLALAGHQVTVYNRTASKSAAWCAEFAGTAAPRQAATPRLAATGSDIVFCCVGNDDDLRGVTLGAEGAFAGMQPGAVFVDHTTASATVARELYAAAKNLGLAFVDAPVSGGQGGAQTARSRSCAAATQRPLTTSNQRAWLFRKPSP